MPPNQRSHDDSPSGMESSTRPIPGPRITYNAALWISLLMMTITVNALLAVRPLIDELSLLKWISVAIVVVLAPLFSIYCMWLERLQRAVQRVKTILADRAPQMVESKPSPPQPLSKRLARYLHVSEEEVLLPKRPAASSMPFWSSMELPQRSTWAKSVAYIRAVLERIRAAVRG